MTYPTHRQYAISFSFIAAMLLYKFGLTEINYYLALPIVILVSKYGGLFPDIDHTWKNVKEKTVPNKIINTLIHWTGGKHRSWQTHSIDILLVFTLGSMLIPSYLYRAEIISSVNKEVLSILALSFSAGWISHLVADMMTSAGVRLFCWNKKLIIKVVPNHIGKLRFNTGHEWEEFVYKAVKIINLGLGLLCLIFPLLTGDNLTNLVTTIKTLLKL